MQYYSECHGVIYVIDSCDPENLAISAQTFSKLPLYSVLCVMLVSPTNDCGIAALADIY